MMLLEYMYYKVIVVSLELESIEGGRMLIEVLECTLNGICEFLV